MAFNALGLSLFNVFSEVSIIESHVLVDYD